MPAARDFLERFRPAGAPGAAAGAGVPADRAGELATELEPVLALLDDTEARANSLRERTCQEAADRRERAAARAAAIVQDAERRSSSVRAEIVARATRHADADLAQALAEADRAADRLRVTSEGRMPEYVARVLAELDMIVRELGARPR
jgi:F0F1-type ATP synthase membrane subunit b/b'